MNDTYDAALICLNGHLINENYHELPDENQKFCAECGEKTIYRCPECRTEFRGQLSDVANLWARDGGVDVIVPNACVGCGELLPWTTRKLEAARALARELNGLSPDDRERLSHALDDLVTSTPRTEVAAVQMKKLLEKLKKPTAEAVRDLLVHIAGDAAKKHLGI